MYGCHWWFRGRTAGEANGIVRDIMKQVAGFKDVDVSSRDSHIGFLNIYNSNTAYQIYNQPDVKMSTCTNTNVGHQNQKIDQHQRSVNRKLRSKSVFSSSKGAIGTYSIVRVILVQGSLHDMACTCTRLT